MEQILLAYGFPKVTFTVIMMLYRNTDVKAYSSDEERDLFNIVADVLLGDT